MASTNQSPFYQKAQANFLVAKTDEDRIYWLDEMIKECPKHKSAESMLANLKTRRKKLLGRIEVAKKRGKRGKQGIKKDELQAVIIGKTKSGKSSLMSVLTNTSPKISDIQFTTKIPVVGMMNYDGVNVQMVEIPAIESEYYDTGLVHTADSIIVLVDRLVDIYEILQKITNFNKKVIIVFNKTDLINDNEKRKIEATLKSRKTNFIMISTKTRENIDLLKEKIFASFGKLRVFTKEPGRAKSENPIILEPNSIVKNVAEKIFKGFSKNVVETKIWGPSSKFPGQKVGLNHVIKDLDIVEFRTR